MDKQNEDLLIKIGIIAIVGLFFYFRIKRARFWSEKGIYSTAKVTRIEDSGMKGYSSISFSIPVAGAGFSSSGIIWDLTLEITPSNAPVRRLYINHRFKDGLEPPVPGDIIPILIHPKNPDKIVFLPRERATEHEV